MIDSTLFILIVIILFIIALGVWAFWSWIIWNAKKDSELSTYMILTVTDCSTWVDIGVDFIEN